MRILRFAFTYDAVCERWLHDGGQNDGLSLHGIEPRRWWKIPKGVESIWLSLHDKPSADRYPMKVVKAALKGYMLLWTRSGAHLQLGEDKMLRRFEGRTMHLQCEYEA